PQIVNQINRVGVENIAWRRIEISAENLKLKLEGTITEAKARNNHACGSDRHANSGDAVGKEKRISLKVDIVASLVNIREHLPITNYKSSTEPLLGVVGCENDRLRIAFGGGNIKGGSVWKIFDFILRFERLEVKTPQSVFAADRGPEAVIRAERKC